MATKDTNEDDVNDKKDSSEDNFGLPDVEYKPLDQPAVEQVAATESRATEYGAVETGNGGESSSYSESMGEETKSKAPIILGIVIILVVLVAGYLVYNYVIKPSNEKARKEQLAKEQAAALKKKQEEEARLAKQREEEERKRQEALAKAIPPVGTIETLNGRTKRYYVVVTSDIDDDLLMDFAKKLSAKGISTKIIPPFGDKKFYRLAVADHETFALAQANADAAKADYGGGVWVMKY
ncbi:MAG TPA: hypothetical protein PLR06_14590 [Cyclobacteriaceae bacterium]|nr:hypothetical protein [Cyclobacteriaceae bacterium]